MSDLISLQSVSVQFNAWRSRKKTRSERIPDRILDEVASLTRRHSSSELMKVLKLSSLSWNSHRLQSRIRSMPAINMKSTPTWVEVKQPTIGSSKVRLRREGLEMELELSGESMLEVVREFMQGGPLWSNSLRK